jgi:cytochrome c-type biogenesis protein CcmH
MNRFRYWVSGIAFCVFVAALYTLLPALNVSAQGGPVTDDQVNAVAKRLNCPVCENVPLDVCETQACVQWRDLIRQKLAAGETPDQIITYFHVTYGDRVLQEPPKSGFTAMLWVLPFIGIAIGLVLLWLALRSMVPGLRAAPPPVQPEPAAGPPSPASADSDEYRRRLERELERANK